jgi:cell wall-associated NlpC family hydrolase
MDLNKYFSLEYKENGRNNPGLDCWGFVRYFIKEELNITLPLFSNVHNIEELNSTIKNFKEVYTPQKYNLVLLKSINQNLTHIGIYLDDSIIHMTKNGVTITKINRIKHLIIGYYSIY